MSGRPDIPVFRCLAALLAALALCLLMPSRAHADTIARDDFEEGGFRGGTGWLAGWQSSGAVDVTRRDKPRQGRSHLRLRGSSIAYRDVSLRGGQAVSLSLWARTKSQEGEDYAALLLGAPGALAEVQRWDSADSDRYRRFTFQVPPFLADGVLRVQLEMHGNDGDDALLVDAVEVTDESPEAGPEDEEAGLAAIVRDGQFEDWRGRPHITDPQGDARQHGDIVAFYWGDNPDDETMYWMVQRAASRDEEEATGTVRYTLHLDMDNNGDFNDSGDRVVEVRYTPSGKDSRVDLTVLRASDGEELVEYRGKDWGESRDEGGSRVEFGLPFADLGFSVGSALRMYIESDDGDRAPDTGDIQWSPIPFLGYVGAGALLALGVLVVWWARLRRYEGKEVPRP